MDLRKLKEPFEPSDIEWRISRAGEKNGKIWAIALAYVTNRAIQDRLDDVCGPENWQNDFDKAPDGGTLCSISIQAQPGVWITKKDGAENTQIEAVKGGLSGAMKRAAVQWGIGRYLYNLSETFVNVSQGGELNGQYIDAQKKKHYFKYDRPQLPSWAIPEGATQGKSIGARDNANPDLFNRVRTGMLKMDVPPADVDALLEKWRQDNNGDAGKMFEEITRLYNEGRHYVGGEWVLK